MNLYIIEIYIHRNRLDIYIFLLIATSHTEFGQNKPVYNHSWDSSDSSDSRDSSESSDSSARSDSSESNKEAKIVMTKNVAIKNLRWFFFDQIYKKVFFLKCIVWVNFF